MINGHFSNSLLTKIHTLPMTTMHLPTEFLKLNSVKGFLAEDEGMALYELASKISQIGPCLELGSYCGLSTIYLGFACRATQNTLYAVDHHRGSEEHQLGEEYHDPELYDANIKKMDSFKTFRATLEQAALEETVVPIVSESGVVLKHWVNPLGLVFIDGGHSEAAAKRDCLGWSQCINKGGYLAVHDIFSCPEEGGQGPYLGLNAVLGSGRFEFIEKINSLGILRKI